MAARKKTSKAVVKWDEELAREAEIASEMESNAGGGQFFSIRGGVLSWQDSSMPNNEMVVIILDTIFENVRWEEGSYDSDNPQPPTCFAFARAEDELNPHKVVLDAGQAQSLEGCVKCEYNEWGSAETGRGKGCKNTRRLAMLPAGIFAKDESLELFDDPKDYEDPTIGLMRLPVTSVKGYANFVKTVAGALQRPPFAIFTRVATVPDVKTQFKVIFEPLEKVGDELREVVMKRREEAKTIIETPYQLKFEEDEEKEKHSSNRNNPSKKKVSKKKTGRKY